MYFNCIRRLMQRKQHKQTDCGKYPGILHGILSVPHNFVMNLNNVMQVLELRVGYGIPSGLGFVGGM